MLDMISPAGQLMYPDHLKYLVTGHYQLLFIDRLKTAFNQGRSKVIQIGPASFYILPSIIIITNDLSVL